MTKKREIIDPKSCWNKTDLDEPVFVLLARDVASGHAIRVWCEERVRLGKNRAEDSQIVEAHKLAFAMEAWRCEWSKSLRESLEEGSISDLRNDKTRLEEENARLRALVSEVIDVLRKSNR